jgi:superfamily II DNA or RNA helicase
MNLSELEKIKANIKRRYRNGPDNIGKDLVAPCLSKAVLYRRGTGFFSSGALVGYASAMEKLIKGDIKIQIICSPVVHDKDLIKILEQNLTEQQKIKTIQKLTDNIVLQAIGYTLDNSRRDYKKSLLSYMIAKGIIEIRFAVPFDFQNIKDEQTENLTSNLYHVKTGYFKLEDDTVVAFDGSFNESDSGHQYHIEQTQVWRSWHKEDTERLADVISDVDQDWNGNNPYLKVFHISQEALNLINKSAPDQKTLEKLKRSESQQLPKEELRYYQKDALIAWSKQDFRGILALATGTGKTKAAIAAIKNFRNNKKAGLVIVTAPYVPLAKQWIEELSAQEISSIGIFDSKEDWVSRVQNIINLHNNGNEIKENLPVLVCVNKSFKSESFQSIINRLSKGENEKLIIVDECHHFNTKESIIKLPVCMNYRLGLSATPYEPDEPKLLERYFGDIAYEYSIKNAIEEGFLSPYEYYPIFIEFTIEEAGTYIKTLNTIQKNSFKIKNEDDESAISMSEVDRLLETVAGKLTKLENILQKIGIHPFTLFYCGEGYVDLQQGKTRQIDTLTRLLFELNWKVGKITSYESQNERKNTLIDFKNKNIDAIASMRVLDEGIDVPDCTQAFILASQRLTRQGVQRRGRILRKSENKINAKLYDFIITGPKLSSQELEKLYSKELLRAKMFSEDATNKKECLALLASI